MTSITGTELSLDVYIVVRQRSKEHVLSQSTLNNTRNIFFLFFHNIISQLLLLLRKWILRILFPLLCPWTTQAHANMYHWPIQICWSSQTSRRVWSMDQRSSRLNTEFFLVQWVKIPTTLQAAMVTCTVLISPVSSRRIVADDNGVQNVNKEACITPRGTSLSFELLYIGINELFFLSQCCTLSRQRIQSKPRNVYLWLDLRHVRQELSHVQGLYWLRQLSLK
jgi:hypothetical protein